MASKLLGSTPHSAGFWRASATIAVLAILAWSGAFVYTTWSPDNYSQILDIVECKSIWTQLGRPIMDVLYCFIFGGSYQPQLQLILGLACLALTCLLIAKDWIVEDTFERATLFGIVITFPFLVNIFGFETGKLSIPLAYLLGIFAYSQIRLPSVGARLSAPFIFAAAVSLYQNSINFVLVSCVVSLFFRFFGCRDKLSAADAFRIAIPPLSSVSALLVVGIPIYLIASETSRFILRAGYNERYSLVGGFQTPAGLALRLRDIGAHYKYFLLPGHPLIPPVFGLFIILSCLFVFLFLIRSYFLPSEGSAVVPLLAIVFYLSSFVLVWATDLPIKGSLLGDGYRHTYPVCLVFAASSIAALRLSSIIRLRWLVKAFVICSLSAFVVLDQSWAFATYRLSIYDQALANRVAAQFAADNQYGKLMPFYVVGMLPASSRPMGLKPLGYDVLGSAFDSPYSAKALLRAVGLHFVEPSSRQEIDCRTLYSAMVDDRPMAVDSKCAVLDLSRL
jgi:hypothetical protein